MPKPPERPPVQVFGRDDSAQTRAAVRFFKERKVAVSYVNLKARPMAPGELRRFVERLGAVACADRDGRAWRDAGLGYLRMDDGELAERLLADQRLLRLPLVRDGKEVSAGVAEATWKAWVAAGVAAVAAAAASAKSGSAQRGTLKGGAVKAGTAEAGTAPGHTGGSTPGRPDGPGGPDRATPGDGTPTPGGRT
jgi:arsenate reductase (glutaredoxin)